MWWYMITRDWRQSLKRGQVAKCLTEITVHHGASNMTNGNMDTSALEPITTAIFWRTKFFTNLNYKSLSSFRQHPKAAAWESLWAVGIEFCHKFNMNFDLGLINDTSNWIVLSTLPVSFPWLPWLARKNLVKLIWGVCEHQIDFSFHICNHSSCRLPALNHRQSSKVKGQLTP